ncbi:MAG TPA: protease modulator HflC [Alphaproteobacteria bacterium]
MTKNPVFYGALGFVVATLVLGSMFIVRENQQVLVLQFGNPIRIVRSAGLNFKIPFIQQTQYFDKRVLDVDPQPERVLLANDRGDLLSASLIPPAVTPDMTTEEGKKAAAATAKAAAQQDMFSDNDDSVNGLPMIVDTFARYRITDPLKFRQRMSTEEAAQLRLSNEIDSTTRDVLGRSTLEQLLSKDRVKLMLQIRERVNNQVKGFGIEIVDVRIGRADLPPNLKESTFNRMRSEREQRAAEIRSFGDKRALEIRSSAEKDRTVLMAEAQRDANILRGTGDEEAGKIYNNAYEQDSEFYAFYRSLDAYRDSLGNKDTTLILNPKGDFFRYLGKQK